jgi:hypothetical protein
VALLNKSVFQNFTLTTQHTMPYKYNESRRHKIKKCRYKVTNWHDYNNGLRQRGDFTIWFTEEALADWHPAKTGARGRPQEYSDIAIETAVFIRQVFHLPLRQTEGFMNSLARVMKAEITRPDFSSTPKRSIALPRPILTKAMEPGSLVTLLIPPDLRSMAKTNGTRKNTMCPLGALGASYILRSMKTIKFRRANSLRRKWETPLRFRICWLKLTRPSRPS